MPPETIANSNVRFIKQIELERVPKPGDKLTMMVGADGSFECEVVRSDWHHDKNMFRHGVPLFQALHFRTECGPDERVGLASRGLCCRRWEHVFLRR